MLSSKYSTAYDGSAPNCFRQNYPLSRPPVEEGARGRERERMFFHQSGKWVSACLMMGRAHEIVPTTRNRGAMMTITLGTGVSSIIEGDREIEGVKAACIFYAVHSA